MSKLRSASQEYEKAEISCLFLHDQKKGDKINLLTIFELIPSEQKSSELIGDKASCFMHRENINKDQTIYITRLVNLQVADAIDKYEAIQNGVKLQYKNLDVEVSFPQSIQSEPPEDCPLLIMSNEENTIGIILPKRNTSFRVWSKLNTDKSWLKDYDQKFFKKLSTISVNFFGYDLSAMKEHLGSVYLCACNSLLRSWDSRLINNTNDLLLFFQERDRKSIKGCELVIQEERAKRTGFTVKQKITSNRERVSLPYFPDSFHIRIYDKNGELIDWQLGAFRNVSVQMNIQDRVVNLETESEDGKKTLSIPKTINASTLNVGKYDLTNAHYLRNAYEERKYQELERTKEFIYFPKEAGSKDKAKTVVRELLNEANKRCIILDPYFQLTDLEYAIAIKNISIPVNIISSIAFLSSKISKERDETHAEQLQKGIDKYHKVYSQQKINCKVLRGVKSPLHDRYLVIDDKVYLLGSSLNEFGSRATTIVKVPTPKPLIEQAKEWLNNDKECPSLKKYLIERKEK